MWTQTRPVSFIKVTRNVEAGELFDSSNLSVVELPSDYKNLQETAIPFRDIGVVLDHRAPRDFKDGDIVFWRDSPEGGLSLELHPGEELIPVSLRNVDFVPRLLRIGESISLRVEMEDIPDPMWLGPFRVVSINNRLTNDEKEASSIEKVEMVGIAVKRQPAGEEVSQVERFFDVRNGELNRLIRIKHHVPAAPLR